MSAIIESILKDIEENYCCCLDAYTKRDMVDPQCQMHDIVDYFRETYKRRMTEYHEVERYYSDTQGVCDEKN